MQIVAQTIVFASLYAPVYAPVYARSARAMAKLYFRYGTVGSGKTLCLLAVAHSYEQQGKRSLLIKPDLDTRFALDTIRSRSGLERIADLRLGPDSTIPSDSLVAVDCVLVDEAQFLSAHVIDQLRAIATEQDIPVICYGLRTDFRTHLFAGSQRLLELADSIEEVKTTCAWCNRKSIFNLKTLDGKPTRLGPSFDLGCEEKYLPACASCYEKRLSAES